VKVAEGSTYVIATFTPAHAGSYTVKATNIAGSATSEPYVITAHVPPGTPTIKVTATKPSGVTVSVPAGTRVITTK
jgi:hypothetical protein